MPYVVRPPSPSESPTPSESSEMDVVVDYDLEQNTYDAEYRDFDALADDENTDISDLLHGEPIDFNDEPLEFKTINKYSLVTLPNCNAQQRFHHWKKTGGTLNGTKTIGCGINALTFLGIFSYPDGMKLVRELKNRGAKSRGTSFAQMIDFVAIRTGRFYQEMTVPIANNSKVIYNFLEWVTSLMVDNECTITKFNRENGMGHSFVFNKDEHGYLWIVDPQNMTMERISRDNTTYSDFVTTVRNQKYVTASLMSSGAPGSFVRTTPWQIPEYARDKLSAYQMIQIIKAKNKEAGERGRVKPPPIVLDSLPPVKNREYVLHSRPVTVNGIQRKIEEWASKKQACYNTACVEHSLGLLELLPFQQYIEWMERQNTNRSGQHPEVIQKVIEQHGNKRQFQNFQIEDIDLQKDQNLEKLVSNIRADNATIAGIRNINGGMGHAVLIGKLSKRTIKNAATGEDVVVRNVPFLYDAYLVQLFEGMPTIREYMTNNGLLGIATIPVKYSFIIPESQPHHSKKRDRGTTSLSKHSQSPGATTKKHKLGHYNVGTTSLRRTPRSTSARSYTTKRRQLRKINNTQMVVDA